MIGDRIKINSILGAIILVVLAFAAGLWSGELLGRSQCPVCAPENVDFSLFWEAWGKIEERFVNKETIDREKLIYGAIDGMVKSLGDPYTVFFPPEEAKTFEEDIRGFFEGVGMEIGVREGQLQVIAPLEGTPAQRAGFRSRDKIIMIDQNPTIDMSIEEAVSLIRGPKGSRVVLTVWREDWESPRDIEVQRDTIEIPSLRWELREGNIAYLRLYQFSEKAASDFRAVAFEILNSPAQKIILDLRNNPGGFLSVAQDIAGWFLQEGNVVAIEDFGPKKEQKDYLVKGPSRLLNYSVVVLINQGTASGAEILAGALRDNRGVLLIGEQSFGKGSIQGLEKLRDGSFLKITTAKWLTPKGVVLTETGLKPDIEIVMTEEDYREGRDPQLERALEIIKETR